ncbi:DapH/DapD/GlmU-related protein [uncultured Bacteroides sp.]|uniref:DapH/DapD/GlmU-related protein n=1 Tax=uncultured Bacteroides sp. TaxID=162156 RepID=UPI002AAA8424|nr:DapH/DapD/GlmU-related protein [uncultured Bacteroides sp.]
MKKSFLFIKLGECLAALYFLIETKKKITNYIYSGYYKALLGVSDKSFYIEAPCRVILGYKYIKIGKNFFCRSGLRMEVMRVLPDIEPKLFIGNNVQFNDNIHIGCVNSIIISNGVLVASNVYITDHFHGTISAEELDIEPKSRKIHSKGKVYIGENVWIGENVTILPDVKIGRNVIVGANSVVTHSFPDSCIIAGVPAKIIKQY